MQTERVGDLLLDRSTPRSRGQPEALLFVHGMAGGSWVFENYLVLAAEAGYEAWALNLRGHCGSRPIADLGQVSLADYVQDVRDVLQHLGPAIVVGHSMGGLLAQIAAAGDRVRAAIFIASAPPHGIVALRWPVVRRMWRYAGAMLGSRPFRLRNADALALILNGLDPAAQARCLAAFGEESGRVARQLAFSPPRVDPASIRCPTLVIGASEDRLTPPTVQQRIARRYGSPYLEAAGQGHMLVLAEGGAQVFRRALVWLGEARR